MIIIDISKPFQLKPGWMKSKIKNKNNYCVWWLYLGITYCNISSFEYLEYIASGKTEFIKF